MKINKIKENGFNYSVEITEMDDLSPMENKKGEIKYDKIVLGYNKELKYFYISTYYLNPLDSYGAYWDITDSGCFSFRKDELEELINELIKLKNQGE